MNIPISETELNRLIANQTAILNAMPSPVLIIREWTSVEFINKSGLSFFTHFIPTITDGPSYDLPFFKNFLEKVQQADQSKAKGDVSRMQLENYHLEFVLASFHGYKGDSLRWLIIHDATTEKRNADEISRFHNNIEAILSQKIRKLKESERIRQELAEQLINLKNQIAQLPADDQMIGSSRPMRDLRDMVVNVAKTDATILITGESGTGKELVANMIRETSNRNKKPFLKINCNTINDSLLESDLFGYEKGAFTGAHARTKGKFEVVDGGTIFLDEIGDISPRMQAALLRVLQDGEIIRVGGNAPIKVNVRIIAATNRDLAQAVKEETFRLDLFYRLNIINISIPPLRERKEDIEDLVTHFIRRYRLSFKKEVSFVPKPVIEKLMAHHWPGNVRELENVIQRAVLMAKSNIITDQDIFFDTTTGPEMAPKNGFHFQDHDGTSLKSILADLEREVIVNRLKKFHGNAARAAKDLGIGKTAFYDKMKRFDISAKDHR